MDTTIIYHRPRHFHFTLTRRTELEAECRHCPPDLPATTARCPDCECLMVYRGRGRLRDGRAVHYFECVHSPREVHSLSMLIDE